MAHAKQVTMTTISQSGVETLLCPVPNLKEQELLVDRIEAIDHKIRSENTLASKLMIQKYGLMDDLLTGRVRVTALLDDDAGQATP